jgi:hypothetical protein
MKRPRRPAPRPLSDATARLESGLRQLAHDLGRREIERVRAVPLSPAPPAASGPPATSRPLPAVRRSRRSAVTPAPSPASSPAGVDAPPAAPEPVSRNARGIEPSQTPGSVRRGPAGRPGPRPRSTSGACARSSRCANRSDGRERSGADMQLRTTPSVAHWDTPWTARSAARPRGRPTAERTSCEARAWLSRTVLQRANVPVHTSELTEGPHAAAVRLSPFGAAARSGRPA